MRMSQTRAQNPRWCFSAKISCELQRPRRPPLSKTVRLPKDDDPNPVVYIIKQTGTDSRTHGTQGPVVRSEARSRPSTRARARATHSYNNSSGVGLGFLLGYNGYRRSEDLVLPPGVLTDISPNRASSLLEIPCVFAFKHTEMLGPVCRWLFTHTEQCVLAHEVRIVAPDLYLLYTVQPPRLLDPRPYTTLDPTSIEKFAALSDLQKRCDMVRVAVVTGVRTVRLDDQQQHSQHQYDYQRRRQQQARRPSSLNQGQKPTQFLGTHGLLFRATLVPRDLPEVSADDAKSLQAVRRSLFRSVYGHE